MNGGVNGKYSNSYTNESGCKGFYYEALSQPQLSTLYRSFLMFNTRRFVPNYLIKSYLKGCQNQLKEDLKKKEINRYAERGIID